MAQVLQYNQDTKQYNVVETGSGPAYDEALRQQQLQQQNPEHLVTVKTAGGQTTYNVASGNAERISQTNLDIYKTGQGNQYTSFTPEGKVQSQLPVTGVTPTGGVQVNVEGIPQTLPPSILRYYQYAPSPEQTLPPRQQTISLENIGRSVFEIIPPNQKAAAEISTLFSGNMWTYVGSILTGDTNTRLKLVYTHLGKAATEPTQQFIKETSLGAGGQAFDIAKWTIGGELIGTALGEIQPLIAGKLGTIAATGGLGGTIAKTVSSVGKTILEHPKEILVGTSSLFGVMEAKKIESMKAENISNGIISGEVTKDILSFGTFGGGIAYGIRTGLPFKFWGAEKIVPETVIEPQILSGKETFPSFEHSNKGNPSRMLEEFRTGKYSLAENVEVWQKSFKTEEGSVLSSLRKYKESPGMYHATTSIFKENVMVGVGNTPGAVGMHGAPSISPHFAGLGGGYYGEGAKMSFGAGAKVLYITPEDFARIPISIRNQGLEAMLKWQMENPSTKAFITPALELGKTEKEAIMNPGSQIERVIKNEGKGLNKFWGFREYTTYQGTRLPIYRYNTVENIKSPSSQTLKIETGAGGLEELKSSFTGSRISGMEISGMFKSLSISPSPSRSIIPSISPSLYNSISPSPSPSPSRSITSSISNSISPLISPSRSPYSSPSPSPSLFISPSSNFLSNPINNIPINLPGIKKEERKYITPKKLIKGIRYALPTASMYGLEKGGYIGRGKKIEKQFRNLSDTLGLATEFPAFFPKKIVRRR